MNDKERPHPPYPGLDRKHLRTIREFDFNWSNYTDYLNAQLAEEQIRKIVKRDMNYIQLFDFILKFIGLLIAGIVAAINFLKFNNGVIS